MKTRAYGQAMFALLGLGAADLAVLNSWAVPGWLNEDSVTDRRSATDSPVRTAGPPARPAVAAAPPTAARPAGEASPLPAPATAPAAVIAAERSSERTAGHRANVLFHRGTWWVGPAGRRTLRTSVELLPPGARIELEGHADESGSAEINRRISERRAAVVAALLVRAGVDPARIAQRAFGEERVTGTGFDRRVELIIRGAP